MSALLLMPAPAVVTAGPVSVWITAAGWQAACVRRYGAAWLVTPDGVFDSESASQRASRPARGQRPGSALRRVLPRALVDVAATARKDVRDFARAATFARAALHGPWSQSPDQLKFIWQHHELFQCAGFVARRRFRRPVVLFVDAPVVWEAARWGVRRPGWGRPLELLGESPQLRHADIVACVSEEVADSARRLGAAPERTIVTPCAVDATKFSPSVCGDAVRQRHGLEGRDVVGWIGSFRRFHGVDLLLHALSRVTKDARREGRSPPVGLFVGDGLERQQLEGLARSLEVDVRFTGLIEHATVPEYLRAMDIAVVVNPATAPFHYSPLKLREYMSSGLAVIAPDSGQVSEVIDSGVTGLLCEAGSVDALQHALERLLRNPEQRSTLGAAARRVIETTGSWDVQLDRVIQRLSDVEARA
jgi:glycosyltransferase involved in cell wall biosynthesis